jgi:hypothetical protein
MSETVFTFPGKAGDAILQWPIAYQWAKATGKKFTCWMDENSCKIVAPLFEAQPCVEKVEFKPGIENYKCGGQPWHFDLPTKDFVGRTIYHLGLRQMPVRQLTLQSLEDSKLTSKIDADALASEPSLVLDGVEPKNRVVLHGQAIFVHNKQTPQFWKFLSGIYGYLKENFDEIVFVGSGRDREVALRTYPEASSFDDQGSFLSLARLAAGSRLMVGVGSAPITLAGALKIPGIRVHDDIEENPKVIWSNLGDNQLNAKEIELRTEWPLFRKKWLEQSSAEVVSG